MKKLIAILSLCLLFLGPSVGATVTGLSINTFDVVGTFDSVNELTTSGTLDCDEVVYMDFGDGSNIVTVNPGDDVAYSHTYADALSTRTVRVIGRSSSGYGDLVRGVAYSGLTSTDSRCSFASSTNWLWWDGKDFSAYAGRNWVVTLTDSAGKTATGYTGTVGTGETLGSELVDAGSFETIIWTVQGGANLSLVEDERTGGSGLKSLNAEFGQTGYALDCAIRSLSYPAFALLKNTIWAKNINVTSGVSAQYYDSGNFNIHSNAITGTSWEQTSPTYLLTKDGDYSFYLEAYGSVTAGQQARFDDASVKQVLTPAATGIQILDAPSGSSGWSAIESGFDYNAVTGITVIPNT